MTDEAAQMDSHRDYELEVGEAWLIVVVTRPASVVVIMSGKWVHWDKYLAPSDRVLQQ